MNFYKLSQNEISGPNTFSSLIVISDSEGNARKIHPFSNTWNILHKAGLEVEENIWDEVCWVSDPSKVQVEFLVEIVDPLPDNWKDRQIVVASWNS